MLWPDFSRADFEEALATYEARVRRFGGALRPVAARREPRKTGTSDLLRVLVAIPAIAFAVLIIWQGGWVFAAGIGAARPWSACTS